VRSRRHSLPFMVMCICLPATAQAHGSGAVIGIALSCGVGGTVLGTLVGTVIGVVKFRKHGWFRFSLFTSLTIISVSIISSIALVLLLWVLGFAGTLLEVSEVWRSTPESSPFWPAFLEGLLVHAVGLVFTAVPVLLFALTVYVWTLSYGWLPSLLLKSKRHVLWILPVLSTAIVAGLVFPTVDEGDVGFWWMHPVLLAACSGAAFLAGRTIVGCSRLAARLSRPPREEAPNEHVQPTT